MLYNTKQEIGQGAAMAILKCKMCGGDIELSADKTFGTCESCGSTMTFPKVDDDQRANRFNRGNQFRRAGEFDKALAVYEQIVQEDENDAEAHWCCALCRFGIEYVEDPNTFEYLPTCHRASFDSFLEDVDYLAALEHSDGITRRQYQKDAQKIAEVQRGILATSQNEEPFDVFICYKESENDNSRTRDSLLAQEIYYQLTEQGRRVFFSRITLEDKAGTEYEPYIFAALNSAKVMIVVTTSAEHVNAVWVKNEWSRFLSLMRKDRTKLLLPCYRDMDPYDLPEALSVLQSYDMSKIGFIQDLIRGVNKVLNAQKPKETLRETVKETVVVQQPNANAAPLLKRAFMFLEDGDFVRADEFCEKVLNLDPENAEAYLGKLMAELHVKTRDALKDQPEPFDNRNNYKKAYRFGDEKLKTKLSGDIAFINERNENARKTRIYNDGVKAMDAASTESTYKKAAETFKTIPSFRDADALAKRCLEQAEICRKDAIYYSAKSQKIRGFVHNYESAITEFRKIPGWKDADELLLVCQRKIEEIKAKEEGERLERERQAEEARMERERQAEEARIVREKAAKKRKKIVAIATPIVVACIAFVIVLTTVIIPNGKYNSAVELYNAEKYDEAITAFKALNGYKDSESQITKCETAIVDAKYNSAVELYNAGKYEEAIAAFEALDGYRDSKKQIEDCQTAIKDREYDVAVALYEDGQYERAIAAFEALDGYRDSLNMIHQCKYQNGIMLFDEGKFEDAASSFIAAEDYKDSADMVNESRYCQANILYNEGDFSRAYTLFMTLGNYKDSSQKAEEIRPQYIRSQIRSANIGAVVSFGSYEQDNNRSNGKESIEWYIIAKNGNKALLLSKKAIDTGYYHNSPNDKTGVTWETCYLRKRLNEQFLNDAFTDIEIKMIVNSTLETATSNGAIRTTDKVFLLSKKEANQYLDKSTLYCEATTYVKSKGVYVNNNNRCMWYLRDQDSIYARGVSTGDGKEGDFALFFLYREGDAGYCIRPAIWVNCE